MQGKQFNNKIKLLILIFLHFITRVQQSVLSPSILRGGLVYSEEARLGPIYINQDHMSFVRVAETSILEKSAQTTRDLTTLYHVFCSQINDMMQPLIKADTETQTDTEEWELWISPFIELIKDAPAVCKSMGGRLPEIRDKESRDRIRARALKEEILKISTGIYYDGPNNLFRFISDDQNARPNSPFLTMVYGGDYTGSRHVAHWEDDSYLTKMALKYAVIYNHPHEIFELRLADHNDLVFKSRIMCEKRRDRSQQVISTENNLLLQLTHHTCLRDRKSIIASTQYLLQEIDAITNLNITTYDKPPRMEDFFPQIMEAENSARKARSILDATQDEWTQEISRLPFPETDGNMTSLENVTSSIIEQSTTPPPINWTLIDPDDFAKRRRRSTAPNYLQTLYSVWRSSEILNLADEDFDPWLRKQLDIAFRHKMSTLIQIGVMPPISTEKLVSLPIPTQDVVDTLKEQGISGEEIYNIHNQGKDKNYIARLNDAKHQALDTYLRKISGGNVVRLQRKEFKLPWTTQPWDKSYGYAPLPWETTTTTSRRTRTTTTATFTETADHNRTRRAPIGPIAIGVAAGLGGLTMANSITSAVTGEAPLSWAGRALGAIFGLSTSQNDHIAEMTKLAKAMEGLKINQDELATTINTMTKRLQLYGDLIRGTFQATATLTMEQDLKMIIRHMQVIQQLTLAKYSNVLLAAAIHKTSPYALSPKELENLADDVKLKRGVQLSRNLNDVSSTAAIIDNQITLLFEVPIIIEANLFNFYSVLPMPVFAENKTLLPEIDSSYIGISKTGSDFISISPDQFTRCVADPSTCHISSPITPLTANTSCVITTYTTQTLTCPLVETDKQPQPEIHITGNRTIFSVPTATALFVKCSEHSFSSKNQDTTVTITGMGEVAFRPSCTITLPDGRKFSTPSAPHIQKLTDLQMFELLRIFPVPTNVVIRRIPDLPQIPILTLQDVQIPTQEELTALSFHPIKVIPFLTQMSVFIVIISLISLLLYCCRHSIKRQIHSCTCGLCCQDKPHKEDVDMQARKSQESEAMLEKLASEFDRLRLNSTENLARWTQGPRTYLATVGRSRSIPNIVSGEQQKMSSYSSESSLPPPPPSMATIPMPQASPKTVRYLYKPIIKTVHFDPTP
jgi:hypothetical protein